MIIAIDFDGTFAADPDAFRAAAYALIAAGHTVLLVSQKTEPWREEIRKVIDIDIPILLGGHSKLEGARLHGYNVDVWIDDNPDSVRMPLVYATLPDGSLTPLAERWPTREALPLDPAV